MAIIGKVVGFWLYGTAVPTTEGADGDNYIRTTNGDVYQKASGAWVLKMNIMGPSGGLLGTGTATPPSNGLGDDGDWYLNTNTLALYAKAAGAWAVSASLKGNYIIPGSGVPGGGTGNDGDWYYDFTGRIVYEKVTGVWSALGTFANTLVSGTGDPDDADENNGDFYLDQSTGTFWKKAAGTWSEIFTVTGGTLYGNGQPSSGLGSDGNTYIDLAKNLAYTKASGAWSKAYQFQWEVEAVAAYNGSAPVVVSVRGYGSTSIGTYAWTGDAEAMWMSGLTAAGISGGTVTWTLAAWCQANHKPVAMFWLKMPSDLTSQRVYAGFTTATLSNTDTLSGEYATVRYSTVAGDTTFKFVVKGTNAEQVIATGITPVASRGYIFIISEGANDTYTLHIASTTSEQATLVATATVVSFTSTSQFLSQVALHSQGSGAGGQRTIFFKKIAGKTKV